MGVKKSVVEIRPSPFPRSYTAASSLSAFPTTRLGSSNFGTFPSIFSRDSGGILHPQPAPGLNCANLYFFLLIELPLIAFQIILINPQVEYDLNLYLSRIITTQPFDSHRQK